MGEPVHDECWEAVHRLYHFLDGDLTSEKRLEISQHLDSCHPCLEALDLQQRQVLLSARADGRAPDPRQEDRLRQPRPGGDARLWPARVHDGVIPTLPGDAVTEAVSWDLAERVAVRVAGREPFAESYHYSSLQPDFEELTIEAEELVARATGLRSLTGPARARATDRPGWVRANVASFQRLLRPVTERLGPRLLASPIAPVSRAAAGVQVGTVLGWMSTRVLGQYDLR